MSENCYHAIVVFTGRVQGVGFRWSTYGVARGFSVTGYVKNLQDGTVELLAEGSSPEVRDFLQSLQQRLDGCIEAVDCKDGEGPRRFRDFSITY